MDTDKLLTIAKTRIGKLAGRVVDPDLAANDGDDDVLMIYLRTALRKAALRTKRIKVTAQLSVTADQAAYTLPADVHTVRQVQLADKELQRAEGEDAQAATEQPNPDEGAPVHYGLVGTQLILHPVPTAEQDGDPIRVYYRSNGSFLETGDTWTLSDPTAPTGEANLFVELPQEIEDALPDYIVGQWFIDLGEASRGVQLTQYFESQLEEMDVDPQKKRTTRRTPRFF
jgi:hypothetical protein